MKSIDATLLAHQAQKVTTVCVLFLVECNGPFTGTVLAFTDLDIPVTYNDGNGARTYTPDNGFTPQRFAQSSTLGVDTGEVIGGIAALGVTEQQVRAGIFRSARMTAYQVNYNDLTTGRHEVLAYGRAGRTVYGALEWITEFRSLSQQLKQPIVEYYDPTCPARFGDARCGKAFTWTSGEVTSVGPETDREFGDTSIVAASGFYDSGVVLFTSGANAGFEMEVDVYTTGSFVLKLPLPYPMAISDNYDVRQDCIKTYDYCNTVHANKGRFRGQALMPIEGAAMVPGNEIDRA